MAKIKIQSKYAVYKMVTAKKEDRRPGAIPEHLRSRMSDLLASYFSQVGEELYDRVMAEVTDSVQKTFATGVKELGDLVKTKLGELGFKESVRHVQPWLQSIVTDVSNEGVPALTSSLNNIASQFSVDYSAGGDTVSEEEGEELLEVEAPKPTEPAAEEAPAEEDATKEDLTAILEGKEPAPAGGEEQQEAAASTVGDVKRRLRKMRSERRVEAAGETREELLRKAAVHLKTLSE